MLPQPGTKTLVLNSDMYPLDTIPWKWAFKRLCKVTRCQRCSGMGCYYCNDKGVLPSATVVAYYKTSVRDGKGKMHPVPAVILNQHYVKRDMKKVPYSRHNVFRRDDNTCQYCGKHASDGVRLTLDHVVPRSMWVGPDSPTQWHNIVTSCYKCNAEKADRTPEQAGMQLRRFITSKDGERREVKYKKPKCPTSIELSLGISLFDPKIPEEWEPYVEIIRNQKLR